jgi:hypothetical protein
LLLQLQRQYGNRHVQRVVALSRSSGTAGDAPALQAKLALGPPGDRYEREADRVARWVVGQAGRDRWGQQEGTACPAGIQRLHGSSGGGVDATVERAVGQARGDGQALPSRFRSRVEQALGADLGAVRVHTGPRADQLNDALCSQAFTVGGDVFVRRDAYRPGTRAGEELLAHELIHTVQQGVSRPRHQAGGSAPPTSAIQRLFGLELELPVLLTRGPDDAMKDPRPVDKVVGRGTSGTFELHIDHSGHLKPLIRAYRKARGLGEAAMFTVSKSPPILELVTEPMEDRADDAGQHQLNKEHVRKVMKELASVAGQIRNQAIKKNKRINVKNLRGVTVDPSLANDEPNWSNYVGIDATNPAVRAAAQQQSVNAYVQATYGIDLRRVPKEFEQRAKAPEGEGEGKSTLPSRLRNPLRRAQNDATKMVEWISEEIRDQPQFQDLKPEDMQNMRGLFSLIAYYLRMGRISIDENVTGLLKKKVGVFFFKVKLSTVSRLLAGRSKGLETLLTSDETREVIIDKLLHLTGRKREEAVLSGAKTGPATLTCELWLEEVLAGTRDRLFEEAVNPGATELSPGMVIENRRFAQTEGKKNVKGKKKGKTNPARFPPGEWVAMAVRLYEHLERLKEEG